MKNRISGLFGKYRDLMLAIALFLVIDLGVLVFNFQSSRLLEADTGRINLAGDLRVYSQQLAKSVLTFRQEALSGELTQTSRAQIREAYSAHGRALTALQADLNRPTREFIDDLVRIEQARKLLEELDRNWEPLAETIKPLLVQGAEPSQMDIEVAANKVVARNIRLMQQAEDLTRHLESMAVHRAGQMRAIQFVAILLALANFSFIVFKFLRTLARSDQLTAEARQETDRILGTVREGLFLLGRDGRVGTQQSTSTSALLGQGCSEGKNFFDYLGHRMPDEAALAAKNFISVLFSERVKPSLLKQLNPLHEVKFEMSDDTIRYLDFEFRQVVHAGSVEYLLVSVSDITEKVVLSRELAGAKARAKSDVEALLAVLEQDPAVVAEFLDESRERLLAINKSLQDVEPSNLAYRQLVRKIARVVHGIKGESGALNLASVENATHAFEEVLSSLKTGNDISGDDLIPVAVALNDLLEAMEKVRSVISRLQNYSAAAARPTRETPLQTVLDQIEQLTLRTAGELHRKVRFESALTDTPVPQTLVNGLREILPQLVRNAIAHGIESYEERLSSGKPEDGLIRVALETGSDGQLILSVEDDGRGLDPHRLRQSLVAKGYRTADQVAAMSDQDVVAEIFSPGFSSLDEATTHAGRGEGLSVVRNFAERLGARLRISSRPKQFTRISLVLRGV